MAWERWNKKKHSFQEPRRRGCIQCKKQPAVGGKLYCYWCGKRKGLW